MKIQRIHSISNTQTKQAAVVYHDLEWEEYRVKFYAEGQHLAEADYHTPDEDDAISTAFFYCGIKGDGVIQ